MTSKKLFPLALLLFLGSTQLHLHAQCANDTIPPVAHCVDLMHVSIGTDDPNDCYGPAGFDNLPPALGPNKWGGKTWVSAAYFNEGSFDDCNSIRFTVRRQAPYSNAITGLNAVRGFVPCDNTFPTFPSEFERAVAEQDSIKFYCGEVGSTQVVIMRAYQVDSGGNLMLNGSGLPIYDECFVTVVVEDKLKPVVICPSNVTVSCTVFDPTFAAYGSPISTDNCCLDTVVNLSNDVYFDTIPNAGTIVRTFRAIDCSGNSSQCTQRIVVNNYEAVVSGKVFLDTLNNCVYDSGEPILANWPIKTRGLVTGIVYETLTDSLGQYVQFYDPTDTVVEVSLAVPFNSGMECPSAYTLSMESCQMATLDVPVHLEADCPLLSVDVSALFLRRCFPNAYTVQAYNLSSETVEDVHVEVMLDSYLEFSNSSIPGTSLGNNTYSFDLGDLDAGEPATFQIFFDLNCEAPLGYTHCTEAHIFPDTVCNTSANWSGADLEVTALCDDDSVRLTVANIGVGNMNGSQDFVVVEDVIMYQSVPFQLNSQESQTIVMPANGATWRLETEEVPNHPWGGVEARAVEGCGGLNQTGLVTMFPLNTPNPFETIDCQENIGSYDPNDKQAFPKGYLDEHFIKANTDIEYHIRFQNTGTDTAFTVVVLDTLSQHLDATSIRPGASSHNYDFAMLDGNVLRFRFDNILLPDSNTNEAASNGFVKFRVSQKSDNADGTRIENRAAIYFDFNAPVLTNTTFHTVGDHFVLVKTDDDNLAFDRLKVYPNPAVGAVIFELPEMAQGNRFQLVDKLGKTVTAVDFSEKTFRFESGNLPTGVYFFHIIAGNGEVFSGKVVLKQ